MIAFVEEFYKPVRNRRLIPKHVPYIAKDTTMRLYVNINSQTIRCFGAGGKILIKTENNLITLKLSGIKLVNGVLKRKSNFINIAIAPNNAAINNAIKS